MRCLLVLLLAASTPALAAPLVVQRPAPATGVTRALSRTIYLNRDGATLTPGANDSRIQRSSIVSAPTVIAASTVSDAVWSDTVACMEEVWSRFDVNVTDVDPGQVPHIEALFAGSPTQLGLAANVSGISPFAADCGVIESSIVFTFTDTLPADPRVLCEVMTQEIGHSYGLEHEVEAADPMSYLAFAGDRAFQDVDAPCGEQTARPCSCRATQNSVQILTERLGHAGADDIAPDLEVIEPANHDTVARGFTIAVHATDNIGVTGVTVLVDGARVAATASAALDLATPDTIGLGEHEIRVQATDASGNVTTRTLEVVVEESDPDASCSTGGSSPGGALLVFVLVLARLRRRRLASRRCALS